MLTFVLLALVAALAHETFQAFDRRRRPRRAPASGPPEQPVPFGPGNTWLAVASDDVAEVLAALGLVEPVPAGWAEGLAAQGDALFVTPPLNGWVLVVGRSLPDVRDLGPLALRVARHTGSDVQGFQADEARGRHGWLLVERGVLRRAYVYHRDVGRPVLEVGHATALDDDIDAPCDDDVMHVAADRSIDPSALASYPPLGLGTLARWPRQLTG